MSAKIAKARRQYVAAGRLARDPKAPDAERAAARACMERMLKKHPHFAEIRADEAPPRPLRAFDDRDIFEAVTTIKQWTGTNIDPRPAYDAVRAYRAIAEIHGLPWNAVGEAVVQIAGHVLRTVEERMAEMNGGPSPIFAPDDEEAPGRPEETPPERPKDQTPEDAASGPPEPPEAEPAPKETAPPKPPPPPPLQPMHERDPNDRSSPGRERAARPMFAWPGWPDAKRRPPYDGSWWNPWGGAMGRWEAPDARLSEHLRRTFGADRARVAEWMPTPVWMLACELAGRRHDDFEDALPEAPAPAPQVAAERIRLPAPGLCVAETKAHRQCSHAPLPGSTFCRVHNRATVQGLRELPAPVPGVIEALAAANAADPLPW